MLTVNLVLLLIQQKIQLPVKKVLEGVKVGPRSNDFNATHNDPLFKNNYDALVDMMECMVLVSMIYCITKQTPAEETSC